MSHHQFAQLYADHEQALYRFVFSMMPDRIAADDVIQAAMTQIWEHFEQYDDSRPFFPWACRFAYRQVLMHRRRESTRRRFFSAATIELLAADATTIDEEHEDRISALNSCLQHLTPRQRELLEHRYEGDQPITDLADEWGRSVAALYKTLERTRKNLADCITKKLATES